jgi:hypothetical protein
MSIDNFVQRFGNEVGNVEFVLISDGQSVVEEMRIG